MVGIVSRWIWSYRQYSEGPLADSGVGTRWIKKDGETETTPCPGIKERSKCWMGYMGNSTNLAGPCPRSIPARRRRTLHRSATSRELLPSWNAFHTFLMLALSAFDIPVPFEGDE